ncbi:hypothetical protein Tco_1246885 [Tanacetum coccineum]
MSDVCCCQARENVALVDEHLAAEEIEKLVENPENVDDSSPPRHDDTSIPGTRLEPRSDKESPEVEIADKDTPMVDVTNIVTPVNVDDEEDEITDEVFELRRRVKRKNVEETRILLQFPYTTSGRYGYLFAHLKKRFMPRTSSDQLADNLYDVMMDTLPSLVKKKVTEQVKKEVHVQVRDQVPVYLAEGLILERKTIKEETKRLIYKAILQEHGCMQEQISSHIQNAIDNDIPSLVDASVCGYMSGHILHVHPAQVRSSSVPEQQHQLRLKVQPNAYVISTIRTRDQDDPHDDAHPEGENSTKRQKTSEYEAYVSGESSSGQVNVEEPGPSTSGNQELDCIDLNLLLSGTIGGWSAKDKMYCRSMNIITPLVQSCQRDPEAPALSLINQDLLYLKKGNSGPEKITFRLVNKCIKKFNPYARYGVENWKNPHAKIFYIRRQKEPGRPKEEIYSNSKIVQVIKTFWELGHEHKFITEIVARRANDCIVSITEPDYKNLNKNDIEDMYLLIMNTVSGQMTHFVASPTLDSANSYVMQGASCTQRKVSMVSFGRISPNSFLSSILLVVVIIVTVVIVMVILIVVVVAIVGVVIVVAIFGVVVVFDGWAYAFHQDKASLVRVPVANVTLSSSAHLLRENTDSVRSNPSGNSLGPCSYWDCRAFAMVAACASRAAVIHCNGVVGWQLKLWLVFQMLTSFWEAFYQHKTTRTLRGYGMIHNEDGDSDANDGDDDEREISWK